MSVFLFSDICGQLERMTNQYWWCHGNGNGGIRWQRWAKLCFRKEEGGPGFQRVHEIDLALLANQWWRLLIDTSSLMGHILKAKYFPHSTFLEAELGSNPNLTWRSIWKTSCFWKCLFFDVLGMTLPLLSGHNLSYLMLLTHIFLLWQLWGWRVCVFVILLHLVLEHGILRPWMAFFKQEMCN